MKKMLGQFDHRRIAKGFLLFLRGYSCLAYNDWKNPIEITSSTGEYFTLHAFEIMSVHHTEEIW